MVVRLWTWSMTTMMVYRLFCARAKRTKKIAIAKKQLVVVDNDEGDNNPRRKRLPTRMLYECSKLYLSPQMSVIQVQRLDFSLEICDRERIFGIFIMFLIDYLVKELYNVSRKLNRKLIMAIIIK
mmetsp:Transcript_23099/g.37650  ORF Transcript_23099/g.37650 Transcript_23099/m.37650 type:complete len:125 (+) Transcript_23099:760-1134(+)